MTRDTKKIAFHKDEYISKAEEGSKVQKYRML